MENLQIESSVKAQNEPLLSQIERYCKKRDELEEEYDALYDKVIDRVLAILKWENEVLGKPVDVCEPGVHYSYDISFLKDNLILYVEASWAYGGHESSSYVVSYEKIFSDSWKDKELKEHFQKMEEQKQAENKAREAIEREEYERLKAKFENADLEK